MEVLHHTPQRAAAGVSAVPTWLNLPSLSVPECSCDLKISSPSVQSEQPWVERLSNTLDIHSVALNQSK